MTATVETQMQSDLLDRDATCRFFGGTRPINPATLYRGVRKGRYRQRPRKTSLAYQNTANQLA
jgi:hypothetical protein